MTWMNTWKYLLQETPCNETSSLEQEDKEEKEDDTGNITDTNVTMSDPTPSNSKKKRKKKKTRKEKIQGGCDREDTQKAGVSPDEENIDDILKELNIVPAQYEEEHHSETQSHAIKVLHVEAIWLRAEEELKRIFGSDVTTRGVGDEDGAQMEGFAGASRRIRRLAARGLIRRETQKRGLLITPRNTWPSVDVDDLKLMQSGVDEDGKVVFGYVASEQYEVRSCVYVFCIVNFTIMFSLCALKMLTMALMIMSMEWISVQRVQEAYEECQQSFQPQSLMALLQAHPYHVDTLLTVCDLYRSTGDGAYADEMVDMCVYRLERGWPRKFLDSINSAHGVHIPYYGHNIALFIALRKYIQILGRRGLHRVALECCKLLLALNNDDPCGAMCMIDYHALRCGQYKYLHTFVASYDGGSTGIMPNMVYSLALARWNEEISGSTLCHSANEGSSSAQELLAKAMMMHPAVLVRLQEKLNTMNIGQGSRWTQCLRSPPFSTASLSQTPGLERLVDIYVERSHVLWKSPEVQEWLLEQAESIVDAARISSLEEQAHKLPFGLTIADWTAVRDNAFPPSDTNDYAHLKVHDFSDTIAQLPPEEIHGMMNQQAVDMNVGNLDPNQIRAMAQELENLDDQHPLVAFLRTLLPWVHAGEQPDYEQDDQ